MNMISLGKAGMTILLALAITACAHLPSELRNRIDKQWYSSDDDRRQFVVWVNETQPFTGLTQNQVQSLLGPPASVYDNQEFPYNGLATRFTERSLATMPTGTVRPVKWTYQTLQSGSKESSGRENDGRGYLLDLVIQFDVRGRVYGAGTSQFTTSGYYFQLLNAD